MRAEPEPGRRRQQATASLRSFNRDSSCAFETHLNSAIIVVAIIALFWRVFFSAKPSSMSTR
jgi:hypothetical protein